MSLPRNLTPNVLTTSNVLLQVYLLAVQFDALDAEIENVKRDRHIALARADMLEPNWGTLLEVGFDEAFTVEQYRAILLGLIQARLRSPSRAALRKTVLAFAPSATVVIRDYFNDAVSFVGPDPATFFVANSTAAANVWNDPTMILMPGKLLESLGFDAFGTQVQVTALANPDEVALLNFVPPALAYVTPAHQFVALIYDREIYSP